MLKYLKDKFFKRHNLNIADHFCELGVTRNKYGQRQDLDSALGLAPFINGLQAKTQAIASYSIYTYQKQADNTRREAPEHPLYDILYKNPNGHMTAEQFWEAFAFNAIIKIGCAIINRNLVGDVISLELVPFSQVTRSVNEKGLPETWIGKDIYNEQDLLLVYGMTVDGITPIDILKIACNILGVCYSAEAFTEAFFAAGCRPGNTVELPEGIPNDDIPELTKSFDMYSGPERVGLSVVVPFGTKVTQQPIAIGGQSIDAIRKTNAMQIAQLLDIPESRIRGLTGGSRPGGELAEQRQEILECVKPLLKKIAAELNKKLFSAKEQAEGYFVEYDIMSLNKYTIDTVATALEKGLITNDEAREFLGLEPLNKEKVGFQN